MAFNSTPTKDLKEEVLNLFREVAPTIEDKKRKRRHSALHIEGADSSFEGYMADREAKKKKKSKKHNKKKNHNVRSPTFLKSIKFDSDSEVEQAPRKKRKSASRLVDDESAINIVTEVNPVKKDLPRKKHMRKLSKDEYEDRRRSPATLKLLCLYPDEYTDCDSSDERAVLVTDDEGATDFDAQETLVAEDIKMGNSDDGSEEVELQHIKVEDHGRTPIPPPVRIFDTEYTTTTKKAKSHKAKYTPSQVPDTNDIFASTVSQMKATLFGKITEPHIAAATNGIFAGFKKSIESGHKGLPVRTRDWETTSGKVRGIVDLGDDSETTENIAFSKKYIESTPDNTVRFSGCACKRLVLAPGESTDDLSKHTSAAKEVTICLLAKGGPADISLESNGTHDTPFSISEGGFWSVRAGGVCMIHNKGVGEMIVWAVTQGQPDTATYMNALGLIKRVLT